MANIKQALGGTTAITLTGTSLGSYASRESTLVNNTANLWLDAALMVKLQMSAVPNGDIWVLLSSSLDNTNMSYPATGTDAAITIPQMDKFSAEQWVQPYQQHAGTDLILFNKLTCPSSLTATATVIGNFGSIAQAFGGNLLPFWGVVLSNCVGAALGSTAAGHVLWYDGIFATSV